MKKSRLRLAWPTTTGCVVVSEVQSPDDDMLPLIEYRYQVDETEYQSRLQFPAATSPSEELSKSYVARYPVASDVTVYFQPGQPQQSTLEPKSQGDWLLLVIGIVTTLMGVLFLLTPIL